jgi:hypothetical protein
MVPSSALDSGAQDAPLFQRTKAEFQGFQVAHRRSDRVMRDGRRGDSAQPGMPDIHASFVQLGLLITAISTRWSC